MDLNEEKPVNLSSIRLFACLITFFSIVVSCDIKEDIFIDAGAGTYAYNLISSEVTAEQVSLSFKVEGGVYKTAGIIYDSDSQRLSSRVASRDTTLHGKMNVHNQVFATIILRDPGKTQVHYAFFVDGGDDHLVFSDIRTINFTPFQATILAVDEDGILRSFYRDTEDPGWATNTDFSIEIEGVISMPEAFQLSIGEAVVPIKYISYDHERGSVLVRLPDHIRAGTYDLLLRYRDEIRYQREITIPAGRLFEAGQYPRQHATAQAFYVYQNKLHTGAFIQPGTGQNSVEYANWDPGTGQWNITDVTDLKPDSWSFNRSSPSGFPDNMGYVLQNRVYFSPSVTSAYDEANDRYYQRIAIPLLDPVRHRWDEIHLFNANGQSGMTEVVTYNLQPWRNTCYFVSGVKEYYSNPRGPLELHQYNPSNGQYRKIAALNLQGQTTHVTLAAGPDAMYLLAYSPTGLGFWNQYRLNLYKIEPETGTLDLLSQHNTMAQGGYAVVHKGRICVFGGETLGAYAEIYDLTSQSWEYINPTYASFGHEVNNRGGFLGVINGKLYNAYGPNSGTITAWDIDYRR